MTAHAALATVLLALRDRVQTPWLPPSAKDAAALRALLDGCGGWEAHTEYRVECWYPPDWEGWALYRFVEPDDVERIRAWVDSENAMVQAWARQKHGGESRLRYRLVEEDVVVLRSALRVVQPETPPLVQHGPSISDVPEVVVRARALALNAEGAAQVERERAEDATRGRGAS